MKILIIEDNPRLSEKLKIFLKKWYIVEIAESGQSGLEYLVAQKFDIVLLDLGLPDLSGNQVCESIRLINNNIPILIVSGDGDISRIVNLLDIGADDYIIKPIDLRELRARINSLNRRQSRKIIHNKLKIGNLVIDVSARKVHRNNQEIRLRKKEFDILEYLVSNPGRILSRHQIVEHAWTSTSNGWVGSVDVHIKQLRDKIDRPFNYPIIHTSYGVGYFAALPNSVDVQD